VAERATIARPYAKAAFEYARDARAFAEWSRGLQLAAEIVADPRVTALVKNPELTVDKIADFVNGVAGDKLNAGMQNFVRVLAANRRLLLLPEIAAHYEVFRAQVENTVEVEVISAVKLDAAQSEKLAAAINTRLKRRVNMHNTVDPTLLGGAVIRAGGRPAAPPGRPQSRDFMLLTLSYSLQSYVGYIFVFWFYLYLVDVRRFDLLRGALFGSLPWLLSIVSIPLGGWLFDRIPGDRRAVPIAGLAGSGAFIALGAHTQHAYLAAICMAFATALVLSVEGPFWATMTAVAGTRSGAGGGVMNMGGNLGGVISPALTPVLAASIGWEAALMVSAALAAVAALLWCWIRPPAPER